MKQQPNFIAQFNTATYDLTVESTLLV